MAYEVVTRSPEIFETQLWSLKNQGALCDAVLIVNGERLAVHSIILASSSDYFKRSFVDSSMKEIIFNNVDKQNFQSLIKYCYTGKIKLNEMNSNDIFKLANKLDMTTLFDSCSSTLEKKLNTTNCFLIWKIARMGNLENLKNVAFELIRKNFEKIYDSNDFLSLKYSDVGEILSSNINKYVSSEMILYNAVKGWIMYDKNSRKINSANLLNHVRMECLPKEFLISESSSLCGSDETCVRKFTDAIHVTELSESSTCDDNTLIAIGGEKKDVSKTIEIYDMKNENWAEIKNFKCNRTQFATTLLEDKLILIGGQLNEKATNIVESYDLKTGKMENLPKMKYSRYWLPVVRYKGNVFAIGGTGDGSNALSYVEKWDSKNRTWTEVAPMMTKRYACVAAVYNNEIFTMGGYNTEDESLTSVEIYNPVTDNWRICASMNEKRYAPGIAVVGKYLYVIGGHIDDAVVKTVEKFDLQTEKWTLIQELGVAKYCIAAGNLRGSLVIAGGYSNETKNATNQVETYDEENNKWVAMSPLKKPRDEFNLVEVPLALVQHLLS